MIKGFYTKDGKHRPITISVEVRSKNRDFEPVGSTIPYPPNGEHITVEYLLKLFQIVNDRDIHFLLMPKYPHEHALEKEGCDFTQMTQEQKLPYYDKYPKILYELQDSEQPDKWYKPETSGLTVGTGFTWDYEIKDGKLYMTAIFAGKERRIRIDPDNVSAHLLMNWLKRLNKNKVGYDEETGTWIGPPDTFGPDTFKAGSES